MTFSLGLPDLFEQQWTMECCRDKPMSMSLSRSLSMNFHDVEAEVAKHDFRPFRMSCPLAFLSPSPVTKISLPAKGGATKSTSHHLPQEKHEQHNQHRQNKTEKQKATTKSIHCIHWISENSVHVFFPLASKKSIA